MVFYHVARNTYRECLREPIFYVLLFTAVFLIGLFPSLSLFVFYEQAKLVADSSMATTLVFGLLAAALCSSYCIAREARDGTMLLLLSKPVHRWVFVLAKISGIIAALTVFTLVCNLASLVSLRVAVDQFRIDFQLLYIYYALLAVASLYGMFRNYHANAPFASAAIYALAALLALLLAQLQFLPFGKDSAPVSWGVAPAFALLFFAVWTMGALTVALATRLQTVPNLIVSSALFFLGLVSNYLIGRHVEGSLLCRTLYALVPNWQFFWMADALASNVAIPASYLFWALVNVVAYIAICATVAIALFRHREVGRFVE